jgi:primosomal protein N' (replication factor Y) (superfamily II helicase)
MADDAEAGGRIATVGSDHRVERALTGAVRVVPDVASFAVDDGFAYSVPDGLTVGVGDLVRVPLGGRRVRGWVIGPAHRRDGRRLRDILGRSGDLPVFDAAMLAVVRWAAAHYVAPMAAVLSKVTPPNLPKIGPGARSVSDTAMTASADRAVTVWEGVEGAAERVAAHCLPVLEGGGSVIVVAATWTEAVALGSALEPLMPQRVGVASSRLPAAEITASWVQLATVPGRVIVGTRDVSWWRAPALRAAFVIGEGRRGMKEKTTPTVHARDLLLKRGAVERFPVVLCDQVPTAEALARARTVERTVSGRLWGHVEVADRRLDPPGGSVLGATAVSVMRAAVKEGRRVLLFTHRRAAAQRCVECRTLRTCSVCGTAPGTGTGCDRCGAPVGPCTECGGERFEAMGSGVARVASEAARIVGAERVGDPGSSRPVIVATERDLPGLSVDVTVIVDADGLLMAPTYRAAEDGLRVLSRAVAAAGRGSGRRAVVQTMQPDHGAIVALRTADPSRFVKADGAQRSELGFPPGGELLAVEAVGLPAGSADELREAVGSRASVHGPAPVGDRSRWLIQGRDLDAARIVLRPLVARWREAGARVRVDADPLDL